MHPCVGLLNVLCGYAAIGCASFRCESSFSTFKKTVGEHRLNCSPDSESDLVHILFADKALANKICEQARVVWEQAFPPPRVHTKERIDKGTKRKSFATIQKDPRPSAQAALKARRMASRASAAKSNPCIELATPELCGDAWTAQHNRELDFQKNKLAKRHCESVINNTLLDTEVSPEQRAADIAYLRELIQNQRRRDAAEAKNEGQYV